MDLTQAPCLRVKHHPTCGRPVAKFPENTMLCLRRRLFRWFFPIVLAIPLWPANAAERTFPFGHELMLDAEPLYGSKRVPMIEIEENGAATIDLWCASVRAEATVGDKSITIVAEPAPTAQCTAERQSGDQDLLMALSQATSWRRDGDFIDFSGATTLRFRLMTN
jgi:hypothetical protein